MRELIKNKTSKNHYPLIVKFFVIIQLHFQTADSNLFKYGSDYLYFQRFLVSENWRHLSKITIFYESSPQIEILVSKIIDFVSSKSNIFSNNVLYVMNQKSLVANSCIANTPTNQYGDHFGFVLVLLETLVNANTLSAIENKICARYLPLTYRNQDAFIFKLGYMTERHLLKHTFVFTLRYVFILYHSKGEFLTKMVEVFQLCHFSGLRGQTLYMPDSYGSQKHLVHCNALLGNFNGKTIWISSPLVLAEIEIDPFSIGVVNAKRGVWKYLLEVVLMASFPILNNYFAPVSVLETA